MPLAPSWCTLALWSFLSEGVKVLPQGDSCLTLRRLTQFISLIGLKKQEGLPGGPGELLGGGCPCSLGRPVTHPASLSQYLLSPRSVLQFDSHVSPEGSCFEHLVLSMGHCCEVCGASGRWGLAGGSRALGEELWRP